MTDFLQISEAALPTDFSVVNYAAADIPAYSVVFADTTNQVSVNNVVDGVACKLSNSQALRTLPIGVTLEIIRGTTYTGGTPGYGQCRAHGIAKVVATAALNAGVPVMNDSTGNGTVVAQTAALPSIGTSLTAAIQSGDEVAVDMNIVNNG